MNKLNKYVIIELMCALFNPLALTKLYPRRAMWYLTRAFGFQHGCLLSNSMGFHHGRSGTQHGGSGSQHELLVSNTVVWFPTRALLAPDTTARVLLFELHTYNKLFSIRKYY